VTQELWTFDDMVPGPTLRGKVGDLFRITFINDGLMGHSIDFHASKVDPGTEMRTIQPGESLVYEFEAKHAGIWMYHCGSDPVLHHTGNGQYGALIVDPPDLDGGRPRVRVRPVRVLPRPEGEPGSLAKMLNEDWDIVAFNGYANAVRPRPHHRGRAGRAGPGLAAERRPEREQLVPRDRLDLRHRLQGGRLPAPPRP
jgi:nitrite reductase (NO-forming)